MKTWFNIFKCFISFSWNLWNIISRRIKKIRKFLTFRGKFENGNFKGHKISLELYFRATRKDPDQKKFPRASFELINLCAKFHSHILTGSVSFPCLKRVVFIVSFAIDKIRLQIYFLLLFIPIFIFNDSN
jgi:hypothetical protein